MVIMKKIFYLFWFYIPLCLFSCKQKTDHGDFTLITEEDKYEALGGAIKINGYTVEYKGKKIDWSSVATSLKNPNLEEFQFLNGTEKKMIVEVLSNYYLLSPNGENVDIKFIAIASSNSGMFKTKPYSELLKNELYFHQVGMRLNLQTFVKDTMQVIPSGRLLAVDEAANKIIYLSGIFENDTSLKKTLDNNNDYLRTGVYNFDFATNNSTIEILEWDILNKQQYKYSYADTTLWKTLDEHYKINSYAVLSKSFDSAFVFNLFKWDKDSIGVIHLIPKNVSFTAITIKELDSLGLSASEKNF
jgi:hypothetical protein